MKSIEGNGSDFRPESKCNLNPPVLALIVPALSTEVATALAPRPLFVDEVDTPLGTMLLVHDSEGRVRALDFHDFEARMRRLLRLHYGEDGRDFVLKGSAAPAAIRQAIAGYFAGEVAAIDAVAVATAGSAFQQQVWAALRTIPPGMTLSYGGLARKLERPKSVRAVGFANGANPIAIVVPCHRVIGADGSLTGYGGGVERKAWLLDHEGAAYRRIAAKRVPTAA